MRERASNSGAAAVPPSTTMAAQPECGENPMAADRSGAVCAATGILSRCFAEVHRAGDGTSQAVRSGRTDPPDLRRSQQTLFEPQLCACQGEDRIAVERSV